MITYGYLHEIADSTDRILNVGCKDGQYLTGCDAEVVALDIKLDPVYGNLGYVTTDGTWIPFTTDAFDYVVTNLVLERSPTGKKEPVIDSVESVNQGSSAYPC
jgi:hypothetical protein